MCKTNKSEYKKGDLTEAGEVICQIIGSCPYFIVYQGKDVGVRWEVDDNAIPAHLNTCLERYDTIDHLIYFDTPRKERTSYSISNGSALFLSVTSEDDESRLDSFELIYGRIFNAIQTRGRISYVVASTILTTIISLIVCLVYLIYPSHSLFPFLLGWGMGSIGALLSIYHRCNSIVVSPKSCRAQHGFLGVSRVILGSISGMLFVVLVKANLLMGVLEQSIASISILSALSGFSERYFPNLMNNLETSTLTSEIPKTKR